jgi:outer membrane cobalamin receptor
MYKRSLFFLFIITIPLVVHSQGIQDSVFNIKEVTKKADRIFKKETAGMKQTEVDTLVLMEKQAVSLSELLSENTPVFIKSHGRGALATASFRGTAPSHTQVTWNGININSPMTGMVDFSLIPVYVIDDMNLKHGASSLADQSGGLGGSININNKPNWNNKFGLKYRQGIGSFGTYDEFLQVSLGNKKTQSKTRIYHSRSDNDYTYINKSIGNDINPQTGEYINPLDTNKHADWEKYGLLQEIYYRPNDKNIVSATYWGQYADRTIPRVTSFEGDENANLNNQKDYDHKVVLKWSNYTKKGKLYANSGYSHKNLYYTLHNQVPGQGLLAAIHSKSCSESYLNKVSYDYNFSNSFSLKSSIDGNYHSVVSKDSVTKAGYTEERTELSAFLSLHKNFADRLNLMLMMRQEYVDDDFTPFVPFFGFDFRLLKEKDLILKGNIARNFHMPTLNDLYWLPGGNPDLLAEEGFSFELGLAYQKLLKRHKLHTEITYYRTDIDNWIVWLPTYKGYWEPLNIKRVLSKGIETSIKVSGQFGKFSYRTLFNYAYTSSINYGDIKTWGDESYGKQLVYVPLHSGNALLHIGYEGFFVTYQYNYYGERFTTSSNNISKRDWLYPYHMNDISMGKNLDLKKIKLSAELKVYNLFDETYHSILYRPMPGRNYLLILTFQF